MKIKVLIGALFIGFFCNNIISQIDTTNYYGLTPPLYHPELFAENADSIFSDAKNLKDTVNLSVCDETLALFGDELFFGLPDHKDLAVSYKNDENSWSTPQIISGGIFPNGFYKRFRLSPDKKYFIYSFSKTGYASSFENYWVDVETLKYLGVKEAPFNYITSWYVGVGAQMEIALHPNLTKRKVDSELIVNSVSYDWMINAVNSCFGCIKNAKEGRKDIIILHETENIATAKVLSNNFFDYIQLVKFNNYWKVINVVWEFYNVTNIGDSVKLVNTLENYISYWKNGDHLQMAGMIHPSFVGQFALSHTKTHEVNKMQLLSLISECSDCYSDLDFGYEILDLYKNAASVKININDSVEYLHLSYQKDKWYLINTLRNFDFNTASK